MTAAEESVFRCACELGFACDNEDCARDQPAPEPPARDESVTTDDTRAPSELPEGWEWLLFSDGSPRIVERDGASAVSLYADGTCVVSGCTGATHVPAAVLRALLAPSEPAPEPSDPPSDGLHASDWEAACRRARAELATAHEDRERLRRRTHEIAEAKDAEHAARARELGRLQAKLQEGEYWARNMINDTASASWWSGTCEANRLALVHLLGELATVREQLDSVRAQVEREIAEGIARDATQTREMDRESMTSTILGWLSACDGIVERIRLGAYRAPRFREGKP